MNVRSSFFLWVLATVFFPLIVSCHRGEAPAPTRTIFVADSIIVKRGDSVSMIITDEDSPVYHVVESYSRPAMRHELILAVFGVLLFLAVLSYLFIAKLRHKDRRIGDLAAEVDAANRRSEQIAQTVSDLLEDKVSMVQMLSQRHGALSVPEENSYLNELENLRSRVNHYDEYMRDLRKQDLFLKELEEALNASHHDIMRKIRAAFGSTLKEDDYRFLACVFAGIGNASIGFVTGLAPGTVRTRKSRYKFRLQSLPDSADKDLFLSSFENRSV